jgi:hypothetical protein
VSYRFQGKGLPETIGKRFQSVALYSRVASEEVRCTTTAATCAFMQADATAIREREIRYHWRKSGTSLVTNQGFHIPHPQDLFSCGAERRKGGKALSSHCRTIKRESKPREHLLRMCVCLNQKCSPQVRTSSRTCAIGSKQLSIEKGYAPREPSQLAAEVSYWGGRNTCNRKKKVNMCTTNIRVSYSSLSEWTYK